MKKLFILGVSAMLMTGSVLTSCSKYEEGSKFTLLTKKSRVVGDWTVKSTQSGSTTTTVSNNWTMSFKKDGACTTSYTMPVFGTVTDTGKWAFNDDKDYIIITNSDSTIDQYEIIELKSKEMKVKSSGGTTLTLQQ